MEGKPFQKNMLPLCMYIEQTKLGLLYWKISLCEGVLRALGYCLALALCFSKIPQEGGLTNLGLFFATQRAVWICVLSDLVEEATQAEKEMGHLHNPTILQTNRDRTEVVITFGREKRQFHYFSKSPVVDLAYIEIL